MNLYDGSHFAIITGPWYVGYRKAYTGPNSGLYEHAVSIGFLHFIWYT